MEITLAPPGDNRAGNETEADRIAIGRINRSMRDASKRWIRRSGAAGRLSTAWAAMARTLREVGLVEQLIDGENARIDRMHADIDRALRGDFGPIDRERLDAIEARQAQIKNAMSSIRALRGRWRRQMDALQAAEVGLLEAEQLAREGVRNAAYRAGERTAQRVCAEGLRVEAARVTRLGCRRAVFGARQRRTRRSRPAAKASADSDGEPPGAHLAAAGGASRDSAAV
jgi:hypothetical protein